MRCQRVLPGCPGDLAALHPWAQVASKPLGTPAMHHDVAVCSGDHRKVSGAMQTRVAVLFPKAMVT